MGRLLAIFLCCMAASVQAQMSERELSEGELIERLEERIVLDETVQGDFQQKKYIDVLPQPLNSHGRFSYDQQEGLVWETLAPIANRLEFDKQGIRQSVGGELAWELDTEQPAAVAVTQVISSVLAADWKTLQNYFTLSGELDENGWRLEMDPKGQVMEQIMDSIVVRGDRVLSSMTLLEANGDRTEIAFDVQGKPGEE